MSSFQDFADTTTAASGKCERVYLKVITGQMHVHNLTDAISSKSNLIVYVRAENGHLVINLRKKWHSVRTLDKSRSQQNRAPQNALEILANHKIS